MQNRAIHFIVLLGLASALTTLPQARDSNARRGRPAPKPQPRPRPTSSYVTVRCGQDLGAAKASAELVFDANKILLKDLRSVALVKRVRFTGERANDKCCETVVTTEGAVHTKDGAQLAISGKAELPIEIGKTTKTCTMDVTTDQTSSFHCYPEVVKQCPTSSHSKVKVLLMVF